MTQDGFEFVINHDQERAYMYAISGLNRHSTQSVGYTYACKMMREGHQVADKPTNYREVE
jgi:hypothetical protein